ncbi:MAG: hypothetical protein IJF64_03210 [Clostridia bacterium]|nr:hypothetical protein [Clostridia bacterium]
MSRKKTKKIVFVCTGNTCRSPMAEILLKSKLEQLGVKSVQAYSAGIKAVVGDTINPLAKQTLEENGLSAGEFSSTLLTDKILTEAFALVCMTEKQRELLMDMRWNALRKKGVDEIENNVYSFSEITGYEVFDPFGKDADCYRYVFGLLDAGMSALIEKFELKKEVGAPAKKRGRPKKTEKAETPIITAPKKRGRPKKTQPKEGDNI